MLIHQDQHSRPFYSPRLTPPPPPPPPHTHPIGAATFPIIIRPDVSIEMHTAGVLLHQGFPCSLLCEYESWGGNSPLVASRWLRGGKNETPELVEVWLVVGTVFLACRTRTSYLVVLLLLGFGETLWTLGFGELDSQ